MGKFPKTQFPYPPCNVNPMTERPYARHEWEIIPNVVTAKVIGDDNVQYTYRVRCRRCQFLDPNPPGF